MKPCAGTAESSEITAPRQVTVTTPPWVLNDLVDDEGGAVVGDVAGGEVVDEWRGAVVLGVEPDPAATPPRPLVPDPPPAPAPPDPDAPEPVAGLPAVPGGTVVELDPPPATPPRGAGLAVVVPDAAGRGSASWEGTVTAAGADPASMTTATACQPPMPAAAVTATQVATAISFARATGAPYGG